MTERVQIPVRPENKRSITVEEARELQEEATKRQEAAKHVGETISDELDAILDEIDDVLEENAQEFVALYIQKGGE